MVMMLSFLFLILDKYFKIKLVQIRIEKEYFLKKLVKYVIVLVMLGSVMFSIVVMVEQKIGVVNVQEIF